MVASIDKLEKRYAEVRILVEKTDAQKKNNLELEADIAAILAYPIIEHL